MGNPYTSVTVTSYNSNPPADDGSQVAANRVQWSTHKTKIGDPLKTAIESINTNVNTAVAKLVGGAGITAIATNYTVVAGDQGKLIKVTASATITTPDATAVSDPFVFGILNLHSSAITLDGSGAQTINGSASIQVAPGDGYLIFTDGSNWFAIGRKTGTLPRGYIDGCLLSNGTDATNDINVAAGVCRDSTNAVDITVAALAGKQLDANWAAGANAGMRNSAVGIANTTYHIYAVAKADGTQDIYAHTSATVATVITALQAETGGADYLYARRIGSILRESAAIVGFTQYGDIFKRKVPVVDYSADNPGTSAVTITSLVPNGIVLQAFVSAYLASGSATYYGLFSALDETDTVPSTGLFSLGVATGGVAGGDFYIKTNTSGQWRARISASAVSLIVRVSNRGWIDDRGKDA